MDQSEVKRIIDDNIRFMMWDLQVNLWRVEVFYQALDEDIPMRVSVHEEYQLASIFVDAAQCDNEAEVLRYLRHELIHLVLAPFDLYSDFVHAGLDEKKKPPHYEVLKKAVEHTVVSVERMLDHGLCIKPGRRPDAAYRNPNPYHGEHETQTPNPQ